MMPDFRLNAMRQTAQVVEDLDWQKSIPSNRVNEPRSLPRIEGCGDSSCPREVSNPGPSGMKDDDKGVAKRLAHLQPLPSLATDREVGLHYKRKSVLVQSMEDNTHHRLMQHGIMLDVVGCTAVLRLCSGKGVGRESPWWVLLVVVGLRFQS